MRLLSFTLLALLLILDFNSLLAQEPVDTLSELLEDAYIREHPELDSIGDEESDLRIDYSLYPFLNLQSNGICLNGSDWSAFKLAMCDSEKRPVNIVHIGDSHIQADIATGRTRKMLQSKYGAYGRGMIVPLKLAGTNEPLDYAVKSDVKFKCERLLAYPWESRMGFTGVSLMPETSQFKFKVSSKEPFESIIIYYSGNALSIKYVEYDDVPVAYVANYNDGCVEIALPFPCEDIVIGFEALEDVNIYGMQLVSDMIGVAYHSIGINGATFESYNRLDDFGADLARLSPDLIIISLGTNEAFGRLNENEFISQVDRLVSILQMDNPSSKLLLITPAECHRRIRRGRRRSYAVNDKIAIVKRLICEYGRNKGIAVYDWYEAAGGAGASNKWIQAKLFSRDRVHYSFTGYQLAGQMLYDALTQLVETE